MTIISLSKAGYGTIEFLKTLDTADFLDLVEYEHISRAIEHHVMTRNSNGH